MIGDVACCLASAWHGSHFGIAPNRGGLRGRCGRPVRQRVHRVSLTGVCHARALDCEPR